MCGESWLTIKYSLAQFSRLGTQQCPALMSCFFMSRERVFCIDVLWFVYLGCEGDFYFFISFCQCVFLWRVCYTQ